MSEPAAPGERGLARYLVSSPDQTRLLSLMADGHARGKHGRELGEPSAASYRARVRAHLRRAPLGLAISDPQGRPRYLIADARANQIAWITPHKEKRSTFFVPRAGVHEYLRVVAGRGADLRPLDLAAVREASRTRDASRAPTRQIASAARGAEPSGRARVP